MASFTAYLVVSSLAISSAVQSDQSEHAGVMRRHHDTVQLNAGGDMKVVGSHEQLAKVSQAAEPSGVVQPDETSSAEKNLHALSPQVKKVFDDYDKRRAANKMKPADLCDWNYKHGTLKTNNCTDPATQGFIEEHAECTMAAKDTQAGCADGSCLGNPFILDYTLFNNHPKRCFITDDDPPKWFFNPVGFWPSNIEGVNGGGTPVCREIEYVNGTTPTECGNSEYVNIMDENECRAAATCLNWCTRDEFRTLDSGEQNNSPKGCHKSASGCIMFNNMSATETPSNPQGNPICKLDGTTRSAGFL